jgi:hypothetical protein
VRTGPGRQPGSFRPAAPQARAPRATSGSCDAAAAWQKAWPGRTAGERELGVGRIRQPRQGAPHPPQKIHRTLTLTPANRRAYKTRHSKFWRCSLAHGIRSPVRNLIPPPASRLSCKLSKLRPADRQPHPGCASRRQPLRVLRSLSYGSLRSRLVALRSLRLGCDRAETTLPFPLCSWRVWSLRNPCAGNPPSDPGSPPHPRPPKQFSPPQIDGHKRRCVAFVRHFFCVQARGG